MQLWPTHALRHVARACVRERVRAARLNLQKWLHVRADGGLLKSRGRFVRKAVGVPSHIPYPTPPVPSSPLCLLPSTEPGTFLKNVDFRVPLYFRRCSVFLKQEMWFLVKRFVVKHYQLGLLYIAPFN